MGEIELLRGKKDGNGKYHMRTVIVLLPTPPYIIIAIVSYAIVSPLRLVPSSRSLRLVAIHIISSIISYLISSSVIAPPHVAITSLPFAICHDTNSSHIDTITP